MTVLDHDQHSDDDLLGTVSLSLSDLFAMEGGGWVGADISKTFNLTESSSFSGEMAKSEKQAAAKREAVGDTQPFGTIALRFRFTPDSAAAPGQVEEATSIEVACPPGVMAGQRMMVLGPAGPVAVALPQGVIPGQTFTVHIPATLRVVTQAELIAEAKERVAASKIQARVRGRKTRTQSGTQVEDAAVTVAAGVGLVGSAVVASGKAVLDVAIVVDDAIDTITAVVFVAGFVVDAVQLPFLAVGAIISIFD